ncbi:hypothetical protein [Alkaliphilus crotonatoxidans]
MKVKVRWIIIAILAIYLILIMKPTPDLLFELSNSNFSYLSISFLEGYSQNQSISISDPETIQCFVDYITSLEAKEIKNNHPYDNLDSHLAIALSSREDETDTYLMEIINDQYLYISTMLKNQKARINKTYMLQDGKLDREVLYKLLNTN